MYFKVRLSIFDIRLYAKCLMRLSCLRFLVLAPFYGHVHNWRFQSQQKVEVKPLHSEHNLVPQFSVRYEKIFAMDMLVLQRNEHD